MLTESISVTGLRLFKAASSLLNFPTLFLHMSFCLFSGRSPLAVSHLDPVLRRDAVGVKAPSLLTHTAWSMLRTQRTALTWVFCSLLPRSVYCSVPLLVSYRKNHQSSGLSHSCFLSTGTDQAYWKGSSISSLSAKPPGFINPVCAGGLSASRLKPSCMGSLGFFKPV